MRDVETKGFILLDVLFGMSLLLAVVALCGYFEQFVRNFCCKSVARRALLVQYYNERMSEKSQAKEEFAILQFEQRDAGGAIVYAHSKQGTFTVVVNKQTTAEYLFVRFNENEL